MFLSCPCLPSIIILLQMQNRTETDDFARAAGCCCDAVCMLRDWPHARLSAVTIVLKEILQVCVLMSVNVNVNVYIYKLNMYVVVYPADTWKKAAAPGSEAYTCDLQNTSAKPCAVQLGKKTTSGEQLSSPKALTLRKVLRLHRIHTSSASCFRG